MVKERGAGLTGSPAPRYKPRLPGALTSLMAPPLIVSPGEPEEAPAAGSRAPDPSAGGSAGRSRRGEGSVGRRRARGAGGWGGRAGGGGGGRPEGAACPGKRSGHPGAIGQYRRAHPGEGWGGTELRRRAVGAEFWRKGPEREIFWGETLRNFLELEIFLLEGEGRF